MAKRLVLRRTVAAGERVGEDFGAHAVDSNGVDGVGDGGGARFEWPEGFAECTNSCTGVEDDVCTQLTFALLVIHCNALRMRLVLQRARRCADHNRGGVRSAGGDACFQQPKLFSECADGLRCTLRCSAAHDCAAERASLAARSRRLRMPASCKGSCQQNSARTCAVERKSKPVQRVVAPVANVDRDLAVPSVEHRVPRVPLHIVRALVEIAYPGNVVLAVFTQVAAVGVDHNGGVPDRAAMRAVALEDR